MANTVRTGYSLAFGVAPPGVKLKENSTGDSLVFEVTNAACASLILRYRLLPGGQWNESDALDSPQTGDEITVSSLTGDAMYEFLPTGFGESCGRGEESAPGTIRRAVPSSGSTLEKIRQQVRAELASWIPADNVFNDGFPAKTDYGRKAAAVTGTRMKRERVSPGAAIEQFAIAIVVAYAHRDADEREHALDSLADQVADYLDDNAAAFAGIEGYFDTAAIRAESEDDGHTRYATVNLVCTVIIS